MLQKNMYLYISGFHFLHMKDDTNNKCHSNRREIWAWEASRKHHMWHY